jgi:predicted RNase H-like HicB family nuclease
VSVVAEGQEVQPVKQRKTLPPKGLILRCVIYQNKSGEYTAECIDLDLMVRRESPQQAMVELKQAIRGYLAVSVKGDYRGLIPRPSPLKHRIRYHFYALRAAVTIGIRRNFLVSDLAPELLPC